MGGHSTAVVTGVIQEMRPPPFPHKPNAVLPRGMEGRSSSFSLVDGRLSVPKEVVCVLDSEGSHPEVGNGCTAPDF